MSSATRRCTFQLPQFFEVGGPGGFRDGPRRHAEAFQAPSDFFRIHA